MDISKSAEGNDEESVEGIEAPSPGNWGDSITEIAIRDERRTVQDVVRRIDKGRFLLDPEFQRDFVWDLNKQSRLIESIILRIPLPVFYVAEDNQGRLIVVDGRQRLTTLQRFMKNELTLKLSDRNELHDRTFEDLDTRFQNMIEDCQLHFFIIDRTVPERARLDIFERVNGGEVLTRQQMRNALYQGLATKFVKEESATQLFKEATGGSLKSTTMQDREFVNRFCSFYLLHLKEYRGDMDQWLARGLDKMNQMQKDELDALRDRLHAGLEHNYIVFGHHSFRRHTNEQQRRSIINASLFDVMSVGLSTYSTEKVREGVAGLREVFFSQMDDAKFIRAITYGPNSTKTVNDRFEMTSAMLAEVFGA